MLFFWVKIFHILSASLIIGGGAVVYSAVYRAHATSEKKTILQAERRAIIYTWLVIAFLMLFQLLSGFTMLSVKPYAYHLPWVMSTFLGFGFICLFGLLMSFYLGKCHDLVKQNLLYCDQYNHAWRRFRQCILAVVIILLFILFMMINRPVM